MFEVADSVSVLVLIASVRNDALIEIHTRVREENKHLMGESSKKSEVQIIRNELIPILPTILSCSVVSLAVFLYRNLHLLIHTTSHLNTPLKSPFFLRL